MGGRGVGRGSGIEVEEVLVLVAPKETRRARQVEGLPPYREGIVTPASYV